jgi:hypothetical protein
MFLMLFLNFTYAVTTVHNSSALLSLCGCVAKYLFRREICTTRHELPDSEIPQRVLVLLKSPASSILYIRLDDINKLMTRYMYVVREILNHQL